MATESHAKEAESGWALRLDGGAAEALLPLRLEAGIEVAVDGASVWVRSRQANDELLPRLAALPASERFRWAPPDQLYPIGSRIPSARLPVARWQAIHSWLRVTLDPGRLSGRIPARVGLSLVESGVERESELLRTHLATLREYLRSAARLRWARLGFAVSVDGRVLVRGTPLPAVPGERWARVGRVYVPVGFHWTPAIEPAVVEQLFSVAANEWLIWEPTPGDRAGRSAAVIRVTEEQFLPVTPSAVRATAQEVGV